MAITAEQMSSAALATSAARVTAFGDRFATAATVFLLLFAVYMLSFSGRFHSIDEESMLAVTDSLARRGELTTNQVLWAVEWPVPTHAYGVDGQAFSKKGPLTSVLALPLHILALRSPGLGLVQTDMLLNAIL